MQWFFPADVDAGFELFEQNAAVLGNGGDRACADHHRREMTHTFENIQAVGEQALAVFEFHVFVQKSCQQIQQYQWLTGRIFGGCPDHCQNLVAGKSTGKADVAHHTDRVGRVGADQLGDRIHIGTVAAIQHGNGLPERQGRDELQHAVRERVRSDCEKTLG